MRGNVAPTVKRFGVFEADVRTEELRKEGLCLRLPGQSFQVLLLLLENPGEMVTREVLRKKLWPEDTFVDFDHGLNAAVNRLREALGDSADRPKFIETLPRRGYRWMVSVEGMEVGPTSDVTPRRWWSWAAALVAVLGLGGGVLWFVRPAPKTPELRLTVTPLTASPGLEGHPSFSPDGNQVAFVER